MNKQTLRQINRQRLAALPAEEKSVYDDIITKSILDLLHSSPADIISVYNPMPFEVDCTALIKSLYQQKKTVCFPARLNPDHPQLVFKKLNEEDYQKSSKNDFFTQGFHYPIVSPDLLLIPVIGFHPIGYRLGYGGGYYDAALYSLRQQKKITAVGLGYSFLEIDQPFFESHDEKLDMIITEKQIARFS